MRSTVCSAFLALQGDVDNGWEVTCEFGQNGGHGNEYVVENSKREVQRAAQSWEAQERTPLILLWFKQDATSSDCR